MTKVVTESNRVFGKATDKDWSPSEGKSCTLPDRSELDKLAVSLGCLKESLRKYSVVPLVVRRVVGPLDLGDDHKLDRGETLIINIQAVHHSPSLWPEPMKFDPHRFTESTPKPYSFLPFIEGPRNCLGQHLAMLESKIVLSLLTQRYTFSMPDQSKLETNIEGPTDPRHRYIVPIIPGQPMNVTVTRRDQ
mmetsp:Transcript_11180/g.25902  ORF Transcript_11180/g.25902 Transcript_11180/m.25902 type:complete len:191 (-) Transcript_11180:415-987(-)|eukprot:CAMPEP_0116823100 /NCGR_PEP_ID=MMETSP0418-20121206/654_1 /TAXON_ID=1158023 /ORGANISM="Astrosyne radiata, Strain 13vi08-1A" /LENGTH=190 /DNA_ID=CAMNT_0004451323 /DNA_START=129 /DNA_END=701 /DNA_ORIENTATION=+